MLTGADGVPSLDHVAYQPLSQGSRYLSLVRHSSTTNATNDSIPDLQKHNCAYNAVKKVTGLSLPDATFISFRASANSLIQLPHYRRKEVTRDPLEPYNTAYEWLQGADEGESVLISVLGVDGWSVLRESFEELHQCFMHLNIFLVFRDAEQRWKQDLSDDDWAPIQLRLFAEDERRTAEYSPQRLRWVRLNLRDIALGDPKNIAVQHIFQLWDLLSNVRTSLGPLNTALLLSSKRNRIEH